MDTSSRVTGRSCAGDLTSHEVAGPRELFCYKTAQLPRPADQIPSQPGRCTNRPTPQDCTRLPAHFMQHRTQPLHALVTLHFTRCFLEAPPKKSFMVGWLSFCGLCIWLAVHPPLLRCWAALSTCKATHSTYQCFICLHLNWGVYAPRIEEYMLLPRTLALQAISCRPIPYFLATGPKGFVREPVAISQHSKACARKHKRDWQPQLTSKNTSRI